MTLGQASRSLDAAGMTLCPPSGSLDTISTTLGQDNRMLDAISMTLGRDSGSLDAGSMALGQRRSSPDAGSASLDTGRRLDVIFDGIHQADTIRIFGGFIDIFDPQLAKDIFLVCNNRMHARKPDGRYLFSRLSGS